MTSQWKIFKCAVIFFGIFQVGCITAKRAFETGSSEKCGRQQTATFKLEFRDSENDPWLDQEKNQLSKFLTENICASQVVSGASDLELVVFAQDASPDPTMTESIFGVASMLTLFFIPSSRDHLEKIQLEVKDVSSGMLRTYSTEIKYSTFVHILAAPFVPFRDNELDFKKKMLIELVEKARAENFRI